MNFTLENNILRELRLIKQRVSDVLVFWGHGIGVTELDRQLVGARAWHLVGLADRSALLLFPKDGEGRFPKDLLGFVDSRANRWAGRTRQEFEVFYTHREYGHLLFRHFVLRLVNGAGA